MLDISIIIPFHQGLHYLKDCLDSLKEQVFECPLQYEVVLVYDIVHGQGDIKPFLEEYETVLPLTYIESDGKGGVSRARTVGLNHAKGQYIYFMDSDDYILEHTLSTLWESAKKYKADVVYGSRIVTRFKRHSYLQELEKEGMPPQPERKLFENPITYLFENDLSVLNLLIKREFIMEQEIEFLPKLFYYSDYSFVCELLGATKNVKGVAEALYIKRLHNDEINLPSLLQQRAKKVEEYIEAYGHSMKNVGENKALKRELQHKLCKYVIKKFTDMMHTAKRKPVWDQKQCDLVAAQLSKVENGVIRKYNFLERKLLKAASLGKRDKTMQIGNILVIKKKKKGLFGNKIQRARAVDRFIFSKFGRKDNWVVFESFFGKNYTDSCKYIYLYLLKHYGNQYKFIWVLNDSHTEIEGNPTVVKRFSFRYFYYFARAKYWVINVRQPAWMEKRVGNVLLQTWHGTPLKKLAFDMDDVHFGNVAYKKEFYMESRKWDYLISDNPFSTEVFQRAFLLDRDTILESGYPRNDILHDKNRDEIAVGLRKKLNIPLDKKTILYAPTWRDDEFYGPGQYKFKLQLDLRRMREEIGEEYVILLRTHYLIADQLDVEGLEDFAFNLSKYDDISELYLISDICITDYSSVFFDYANLKRPILFFTYDLDKYKDVLRGFYIDMETELPGTLLETEQEVLDAIKNIGKIQESYMKKYEEFYQRFCSLDDGNAAKRVVETVFRGNKK